MTQAIDAGQALPGIVPAWKPAPTVRAFVSTREGGVSEGPYGDGASGADGLNLGEHVGDDPARVARNRARLQARVPGPIRWLQQVHGVSVWDADAGCEAGVDRVPVADAALTSTAGTVLAIMTADCLPVLLADAQGRVVGCAHAGWRGLAAGVLTATVEAMRQRVGADASLSAWLGPAIGPGAFEVGSDVLEAFVTPDPQACSAFVPCPGVPGKWLADLYALARRQLAASGVTAVSGGDLCTVTDARRFYSHRRDRVTGRMASLIWIARSLEP